MTAALGQPGALNWLLDDLVDRVPFVRQCVVLSVDGLMLGASRGLTQEDAEHLSAVAAGFQSLARGAGRHFGGGPVRQTVIEMESAFLFVTAAGQGACLAVLAEADSDIGLIAYEMAMLVTRVGQNLSSPARTSLGPPSSAPSSSAQSSSAPSSFAASPSAPSPMSAGNAG